MKTFLEAEAPCVSTTTDIWTSMATEAYMTVTLTTLIQAGKCRILC